MTELLALGRSVHNRDEWTIAAISRRGDLTIDGESGRAVLPRAYVDEHVELAYAQTSHAAQGRTADRVLIHANSKATNLVDQKMLYVAISRAKTSALYRVPLIRTHEPIGADRGT